MFQPADISQIVFEVVRQMDDQTRMAWEDDRSRAAATIARMQKK
jgi:hypothetical protein